MKVQNVKIYIFAFYTGTRMKSNVSSLKHSMVLLIHLVQNHVGLMVRISVQYVPINFKIQKQN